MLDFPIWFGLGSYGGLACSFLAAAGIASYALARRRGTPLQLARTILVCLVASCLMLCSIWWNQTRLDLYGPSLALSEVIFWLTWTAFLGWCLPLGAFAGYLALAAPQTAAPSQMVGRKAAHSQPFAMLDDPARHIEPLGANKPWGQLIPLDGPNTDQPLPLMQKLILLGREVDNDIVTDDERTSRHHAEIHWDHGHIHLRDRDSMNGTRVNQQAARGPVPLKSGDIVELGAQRYRVELLPMQPSASLHGDDADDETRKIPGATRDEQASESTPQPLALVALNGTQMSERWELSAPIMTIGRDQERQICLPYASVSRLHAQIVRQRSGYFISDLHSSNGTTVNSQLLSAPTLLLAGDVVGVGEIELRCEALALDAAAQAHSRATASPVTIPLSFHQPPDDIAQPTSAEDVYLLTRSARLPRDHERPRLGPPRLTPSQPEPSTDETIPAD